MGASHETRGSWLFKDVRSLFGIVSSLSLKSTSLRPKPFWTRDLTFLEQAHPYDCAREI